MKPVWRIAATWLAMTLTVATCGATGPSEPVGDGERDVVVSMSVTDGRDPQGIDVTATQTADGEPHIAYVVDIIGTKISVNGATCAEALDRAARQAEAMNAVSGTSCNEVERRDRIVVHRVTATTGGDGAARFRLHRGEYVVTGFVQIDRDNDGCHYSGGASLQSGEVTIDLVLDSDTCV